MCGIAGIISLRGSQDFSVLNEVKAMTQKLRHRGPDGEGYSVVNRGHSKIESFASADSPAGIKQQIPDLGQANTDVHIAIGHRRLSILDLSIAGHQPMHAEDGKMAISYNGEIYNYLELRDALKELGHTFKTESDTEVVLACYKEYGEQMVSKLNGMWAFAIVDLEANTLFLSRDRTGVKPLYYVSTGTEFAFASEQKALLGLPFLELRLNRGAAFEYLVNAELERDPQGLFDKVLELQAGGNLKVQLDNCMVKVWTYYQLPYKVDYKEAEPERMIAYSHKVRRLLISNLKLRLRSDVKIGTCLSGGIDSSTIVCLVDKLLKENKLGQIGETQHVFSAVYKDKRIDESKWAKLVVDATSTTWHKVEPTSSDFITDLEKWAYTHDLPVLGASTFAQYKVMQLVNQTGIKVTLDGQGADEIFGGYQRHFNTFMGELLENQAFGMFFANLSVANTNFASRMGLVKFLFRQIKNRGQKPFAFINQDTHQEFGYLRDEFFGRYKKRITADSFNNLNTQLHSDFTGTQLKSLLRTADRNSMAFGVEARVPFADDNELAEYVFKIYSTYKIQKGTSKVLLRTALGDTLPSPILYRRDKMGFVAPEGKWLLDNSKVLRGYINQNIRDVLDFKQINANWDKIIRNAASSGNTSRLWRIINFAVWRQVYKI